MCKICEENGDWLTSNPADYYFTCGFKEAWSMAGGEKYGTVWLAPIEYFKRHGCCDLSIGSRFKCLGPEACEGEFDWDHESNPVSNLLDMYDKMVEWGFVYDEAFVDMCAGPDCFGQEVDDGDILTTDMVKNRPNGNDEQWDDKWFNEEESDSEDVVGQAKLVQSFANCVMKQHKEGSFAHFVGKKIHDNAATGTQNPLFSKK